MRILDRTSLWATVDRFNQAVFRGADWSAEANAIAGWTAGRLLEGEGYAGSFALTDADWSRPFRLFTGEQLTTRAGRAHVLAEEATRMLAVIARTTGVRSPALGQSEARLAAQIFDHPGSRADSGGEYCCGTCSVALWRSLAAGVFPGHASALREGIRTLGRFRLPGGGWRRFPFYYTVWFLAENGGREAVAELSHHVDTLQRRSRLLRGKEDPFSDRRREILERALARAA